MTNRIDRIDLQEQRRLANLKATYQKRYDQLKTDRAIQNIEANTDRIVKTYITSACMVGLGWWLISLAFLKLF